MREFGVFDSVFLAKELLVVATLSDLVDLDGLVALGCHQKLSRVVIIEAKNEGLRPSIFNIVAPK